MPSATLLFTNSAGQLAAHSDGFLQVTWGAGARPLAATQALFEQMLAQLQRYGWSRILIDQRAMTPFDKAEQTWITTDWLPRAVREGGYRYGAVVVSPTVLVRLATAFITTYVQGLPLLYRSFDTEADALRWLMQQPG